MIISNVEIIVPRISNDHNYTNNNYNNTNNGEGRINGSCQDPLGLQHPDRLCYKISMAGCCCLG